VVVAAEFDGPPDRARTGLLWRLRATTDSRIEPVAVGVRQWDEDRADPLIAAARAEGEEIAAPA